jgi:glycosyltransferase involved in cell wall biosynthesis
LIQPGNSEQLAAAMNILMNAAREQRQILSTSARQLCCENYSFESIAERWIELYVHYLPATYLPQMSGAGLVA